MLRYSVENPMAGATIAYTGRNAIVKRKEPGIARELGETKSIIEWIQDSH